MKNDRDARGKFQKQEARKKPAVPKNTYKYMTKTSS